MYDNLVLNEPITSTNNNVNIDSIFDNLTSEMENVNKFITDVSKKKRINDEEHSKLEKEKRKLERSRVEFEDYCEKREKEMNQKQSDIEQYILVQQEKLRKAEVEFRNNMSISLSNLEQQKKELDDSLKNLEQEKEKFRILKETSEKKIEFEKSELERKCLKFSEIVNQFNDNFKFNLEEEE